ncbi:unnamed protein product, partial [Trichogramma brassicae]
MARSRSLTNTPARPRAHTHTHPSTEGLAITLAATLKHLRLDVGSPRDYLVLLLTQVTLDHVHTKYSATRETLLLKYRPLPFTGSEVNNTHNVSYGGSNSVTNVSAYSSSHQYTASSGGGVEAGARAGSGGTVVATTCSSSSSLSSPSGVLYGRNVGGGGGGADGRIKDQDVVVLLPPGKSRTPRIKHKLATRHMSEVMVVQEKADEKIFIDFECKDLKPEF